MRPIPSDKIDMVCKWSRKGGTIPGILNHSPMDRTDRILVCNSLSNCLCNHVSLHGSRLLCSFILVLIGTAKQPRYAYDAIGCQRVV